MASVVLKNIAKQVKFFIENLVYNGLDLATNENIRQIEFFLQNSSQVETYRLALSLRYLHVEIKRFLQQSQAFSMDRYVFFLSNCWLLSRAFLSQEFGKDSPKNKFFQILLGKLSQNKILKSLKLRIVGIEKVFLEGSMFGIILYLVSLTGKTKSSIFKWSILQTPKVNVNPETMLTFSISKNKIKVIDLFYKDFYTSDLSYSEEEMLIQVIKKIPPCLISVENNPFPVKMLEKYQYNAQNLYNKILKEEITPFDPPTKILCYLLIKNVKILDFYRDIDEGRNNRIPVYIFKISHDGKYPLFIRVQEKNYNQTMIANLQKLKEKKANLKVIFGKLIMERGQLSIFPLSVYDDTEDFICLSEKSPKPNEVLKVLFHKNQA